MYTLKRADYVCNGQMSCGRCEEILPGFLTKYFGEIMISETGLSDHSEEITHAIESCPVGALELS